MRPREFITIQNPTEADDSHGGQSITWANTHTNVPAKVQPVRGRESTIRGVLTTAETYLVEVRAGLTVTTRSRILWSGKTLNVRTAQDRRQNDRHLILECEVGTGAD